MLFEARRMLGKHPSIIFQTSGTYREDYLEEIATEVVEERVLFAGRSPVHDQEFEMARVQSAPLSDSQKEKLWGSNALTTFAFAGGNDQDLLPRGCDHNRLGM